MSEMCNDNSAHRQELLAAIFHHHGLGLAPFPNKALPFPLTPEQAFLSQLPYLMPG
jgi:hypothetical protein